MFAIECGHGPHPCALADSCYEPPVEAEWPDCCGIMKPPNTQEVRQLRSGSCGRGPEQDGPVVPLRVVDTPPKRPPLPWRASPSTEAR